MLERYLLSHPWLSPLVWAALYISDYYMTLWGARLYRQQSFCQVEGSYELTPVHQKDVDNLRPISPTFLWYLIIGILFLALIGQVDGSIPQVYGAFVGFFVFLEVVVHLRHSDNILFYRRLASPNPGVTGHILSSREQIYTRSAAQLAGLGSLLLLTYAVSGSYLLLGGSLSVLYTSLRHRLLAKRCAKSTVAPAPEDTHA